MGGYEIPQAALDELEHEIDAAYWGPTARELVQAIADDAHNAGRRAVKDEIRDTVDNCHGRVAYDATSEDQ